MIKWIEPNTRQNETGIYINLKTYKYIVEPTQLLIFQMSIEVKQ